MLRPIRAVQHPHLEERLPPVLANRSFFLLMLQQIISQTAQNTVLYGLIILVVERTKSATSTSVLVLLFVIPTIAFGLVAGLLVDRWDKRRLLILCNTGQGIASIAYFFARDYVLVIYVITVFFSSLSQLSTTSNAASIPYLVPRKQLISANSLFSGTFTFAQIGGLIVLSPILLRAGGATALFSVAVTAFFVAALVTRLMPNIGTEDGEEHQQRFPSMQELRGAFAEFRQALAMLRTDSQSTLAMMHITASSTLILLFAILVPKYMQAILKVDAKNAVTIFAPVAIGALVGLRAVPWVVGRLGKTRTVALGMFGIAVCLLGLGFVDTIGQAMQQTAHLSPFGERRTYFGLSILVAITMALAGPLGFAYAMLNTPAQTTLHERIPVEMRGRVLASQMVLANGVALIPLIVAGGIADLYGISAVVIAIGVLVAIGGALSLYLDQRWLRHEGDQPPSDGGAGHWERRVSSSIDTI